MKRRNSYIAIIIIICITIFLFPESSAAETLTAVECTYKIRGDKDIKVALIKDSGTGKYDVTLSSAPENTTLQEKDKIITGMNSKVCPTLYEYTTNSNYSTKTETEISTSARRGGYLEGGEAESGIKITASTRNETEHLGDEKKTGPSGSGGSFSGSSAGRGEEVALDCEAILGKTQGYIQVAFNWIRIIAPILLILFGGLDFGQAVISNDQDALKKSVSKFSKRAIAALTIFFLPLIINIILTMPGLEGLNITNVICGIK